MDNYVETQDRHVYALDIDGTLKVLCGESPWISNIKIERKTMNPYKVDWRAYTDLEAAHA